uniref:Uncharacterized protein n=1 Tax=Oryza nivara TaxID=4536 RepID=A0A0E0FF44_ORYNI
MQQQNPNEGAFCKGKSIPKGDRRVWGGDRWGRRETGLRRSATGDEAAAATTREQEGLPPRRRRRRRRRNAVSCLRWALRRKSAAAARDKAAESKDQTSGFLGEKTEKAKQKATETDETARWRVLHRLPAPVPISMPAAFCYILIIVRVPLEPLDADGSEARVLHQDFILLRRRRQAEDHRDGYTKESAVAGKDKTGSVLQQASEQVKSTVVGAKDAVMNTLG